MRLSILSPLAVAVALIPQSYAWGVVGHEVVATIAQMHLHPTVMPKLCEILAFDEECHLAPVAAWADNARRQGKYRWTAPLHYIGAVGDFPPAGCAFPGLEGWEGRTHINVLNAIRNTTNVLQEFEGLRSAGIQVETEPDETVPYYIQDALKFLIHFVGDMHMPLHLTGRNRGGNGDKVAFDGRSTNLHSVWDSLLISERLRTLPRNYTLPLPLPEIELFLRDTIYDPYIRRLVWEGLLDKWEEADLEEWILCPSASSSAPRHASTPQSFFSLFSSIVGKSKGSIVSESDGGLGVDDDVLCPYAWAKPIHQLNCDIVFPKELDEHTSRLWSERADDELTLQRKKSHYFELNTPEYAGAIKEKWIVEKLLTQAGVRLAAVLNWIYADVDEDAQAGWYPSL